LQIRGLSDFKLAQIIFGQKQFTADPLISTFESMCNQTLKVFDNSKEFLKNLISFRNQFKKQVQYRNDLLHMNYFGGGS
jgi:hypothetical protein